MHNENFQAFSKLIVALNETKKYEGQFLTPKDFPANLHTVH